MTSRQKEQMTAAMQVELAAAKLTKEVLHTLAANSYEEVSLQFGLVCERIEMLEFQISRVNSVSRGKVCGITADLVAQNVD